MVLLQIKPEDTFLLENWKQEIKLMQILGLFFKIRVFLFERHRERVKERERLAVS